jgi:hypothetical protein
MFISAAPIRRHQDEVNTVTVSVGRYLSDGDSRSEQRRQHVELSIDAQGEKKSNTLLYVTIYACLVMWLFNILFGLIAYVLSGKLNVASVANGFKNRC